MGKGIENDREGERESEKEARDIIIIDRPVGSCCCSFSDRERGGRETIKMLFYNLNWLIIISDYIRYILLPG